MIYVSREKLDRDIERYDTDRCISIAINIMAKAFVPVFILECFLSFLMTSKVNFLFSIFVFAVLDATIPFIVCFSLIWIIAGIQIIRTSGGISGALKNMRNIKRSRGLYRLLGSEICSDKVMAEAYSLLETAEKQGISRIPSLSILVSCHAMRCEFDEAAKAFDEMQKLPKNDLLNRNDYMVAALDYSMTTQNDDLFIETIAEYADILNTWTERIPSSVPLLLSVAAYEQKLYGNYETASRYLEWSMEYRIRMQKNGKYVNQSPLSNLKKYNVASLLLDMAECHMLCGDIDRAYKELKMSDDNIKQLEIPIPPIFSRERERILSSLTNHEK